MDKQEWFSLPYVTGNFGNVGIEKVGDDYELVPQNIPCRTVWVGTAWPYIAELLSQVELAHGRVLCTGLGLGLVPLLIAEADNVDHVWVVENDPDVISAFFVQGFDLSKITILECDADEVQGVFDFIALDHYNGFPNGMHGFVKMTQSFKARFPSSDVIAYLWPTLHTYTKLCHPQAGVRRYACQNFQTLRLLGTQIQRKMQLMQSQSYQGDLKE